MGFQSQAGVVSSFQHPPSPVRRRLPGLVPIGQTATFLSCLIWWKLQLHSSQRRRTAVSRGDGPRGPRGALDGVHDVVSCVQSVSQETCWRGVGGAVSAFDHPLETPWSFGGLQPASSSDQAWSAETVGVQGVVGGFTTDPLKGNVHDKDLRENAIITPFNSRSPHQG